MNYFAYGIALLFGLALGFMATTLWMVGRKSEKAIAVTGAVVVWLCFAVYPLASRLH